MIGKVSSPKGVEPKHPTREPTPPTKEETDRTLDEQLAESFPASDPPSILRRI